MELANFLAKYKGLVAAGHKAKLQRMYMLIELRPLVAVWQSGHHTSWRSFIENERLCPYTSLVRFEDATRLFKKAVIEEIGVDAAIALQKTEEHLREPTLAKIRAYIKVYKQPPTLMMVWCFVRALRLLPLSVVTKGGKRTYVQRH
jgi:hypothetical protein